MNDMAKNLLLWVIIAVVLLTVFQSFNPRTAVPSDVPYSEFTQQVGNGGIASVTLSAEVPSKATETLMISLFDPTNRDGLAQGLRRSQLQLIAQASTAHPFYWAAFTIIGDDRSAGSTASVARNSNVGQP